MSLRDKDALGVKFGISSILRIKMKDTFKLYDIRIVLVLYC